MAERKLGRGLDALLRRDAVDPPQPEEALLQIPLPDLQAGAHQPRVEFDESKLQELAASIRQSGVLQPVIVRRAGVGYEIVAGERRVRAAKLAGLTEVPAIVRAYDDEETLVLSLVENIQRDDLNAVEKGRAYQRLLEKVGCTQEELGQKLGIDGSTVSNMMRLLKLPVEIQDLVRTGDLGMGHARALLAFEEDSDRLRVAHRILREGLSVRRVEEMARLGGRITPKRQGRPRKTPQIAELEGRLRRLLGTKVSIQDRRGKGRIQIEYFSAEEFERILEVIQGGGGERGFARA